jgi:hypothetical protein
MRATAHPAAFRGSNFSEAKAVWLAPSVGLVSQCFRLTRRSQVMNSNDCNEKYTNNIAFTNLI